MRLYLEPSILVKIFKHEEGSEKVADIISFIDSRSDWAGYTSRWSYLEVARALRKDGKPKELIELNIKEMKSHKIGLEDLSRRILHDAVGLIATYNIYASDALHAATFMSLQSRRAAEYFLSDDKHYARLRRILPVMTLKDVKGEHAEEPSEIL